MAIDIREGDRTITETGQASLTPGDGPGIAKLISRHLQQGKWLWLLLDYDGTLADFAPTPDHIYADRELIQLIEALARQPRIQIAVISGRRLKHILDLLPVEGIHLVGTYGLEIRSAEGERIDLLDLSETRQVLDKLKPRLESVLLGRPGFYLEDKGWSLAIHGRFAEQEELDEVLGKAEKIIGEAISKNHFRVLGGNKFLEVCPTIASKGDAVTYLLGRYPLPEALPVYIGDDDKDEEAFEVIRERGGLPILVAEQARETRAAYRLPSPQEVRRMLEALASHAPPAD